MIVSGCEDYLQSGLDVGKAACLLCEGRSQYGSDPHQGVHYSLKPPEGDKESKVSDGA